MLGFMAPTNRGDLLTLGKGKQIKALLQGPEYGKSLDDMVKSTQDQLGAIDKRVNRLTRGTIVSTFATVSTTASQINTIQGDTRKLTSVTRDVKNDTGAIKGYTETMQAEITDIGNSVHGMRDTHEKAFHHITNLLVGQEQNSICMPKPRNCLIFGVFAVLIII